MSRVVTMPCPACGFPADIRSSSREGETVRKQVFECRLLTCGATFVVLASIEYGLRPSALPVEQHKAQVRWARAEERTALHVEALQQLAAKDAQLDLYATPDPQGESEMTHEDRARQLTAEVFLLTHRGQYLEGDKALLLDRCTDHVVEKHGCARRHAESVSLRAWSAIKAARETRFVDVDRCTSSSVSITDPATGQTHVLTIDQLLQLAGAQAPGRAQPLPE